MLLKNRVLVSEFQSSCASVFVCGAGVFAYGGVIARSKYLIDRYVE